SHLAILKEWLDERGIGYFYLDGRTRNRQELVDAFNSADGPPLFLISLKAGGTGLNLATADYVIHMDPWWNPAVEQQATDRAHRIGQLKPVFVYRLVAENTVEEKVVELQEKKKELFES
ncbi:MAG TPA: C-terminal helicase domain-containing protein, partial [Myxococcota bacterium]|nr:C-terminal helicase domain-containing protein [Myxococcota bacterium]